MFRLSPVLGLRPMLADRLLMPKVPNRAIRTPLALARTFPIASNTPSTASPVADLATPVRSVTPSAISDLFTRFLPLLPRSPNARFTQQTIADDDAHG